MLIGSWKGGYILKGRFVIVGLQETNHVFLVLKFSGAYCVCSFFLPLPTQFPGSPHNNRSDKAGTVAGNNPRTASQSPL